MPTTRRVRLNPSIAGQLTTAFSNPMESPHTLGRHTVTLGGHIQSNHGAQSFPAASKAAFFTHSPNDNPASGFAQPSHQIPAPRITPPSSIPMSEPTLNTDPAIAKPVRYCSAHKGMTANFTRKLKKGEDCREADRQRKQYRLANNLCQ